MSLEQRLNNIILQMNQRLKLELKRIQIDAVNKLRKTIWENVYQRRDPIEYERTYELYNSISMSEIRLSPNGTFEFEIYIDAKKMNHTSVVTKKRVYIGYFINDGHNHPTKIRPWFHQYPGANFIEDAIKLIEKEVRARVRNAISVEVKRIGKY